MKKHRNGFTMLEVVLVLAIAGLIFLMIFIAVPMLQRSGRDAERKRDISRLSEKLKDYQTNNRGALPSGAKGPITKADANSATSGDSSWASFYRDYLDGFEDPRGNDYQLQILECGGNLAGEACQDTITNTLSNIQYANFDSNDYTIYIVLDAKCSSESSTSVIANSNRRTAILYPMERGGAFCTNT